MAARWDFIDLGIGSICYRRRRTVAAGELYDPCISLSQTLLTRRPQRSTVCRAPPLTSFVARETSSCPLSCKRENILSHTTHSPSSNENVIDLIDTQKENIYVTEKNPFHLRVDRIIDKLFCFSCKLISTCPHRVVPRIFIVCNAILLKHGKS